MNNINNKELKKDYIKKKIRHIKSKNYKKWERNKNKTDLKKNKNNKKYL